MRYAYHGVFLSQATCGSIKSDFGGITAETCGIRRDTAARIDYARQQLEVRSIRTPKIAPRRLIDTAKIQLFLRVTLSSNARLDRDVIREYRFSHRRIPQRYVPFGMSLSVATGGSLS
jgi:hypothetical protein